MNWYDNYLKDKKSKELIYKANKERKKENLHKFFFLMINCLSHSKDKFYLPEFHLYIKYYSDYKEFNSNFKTFKYEHRSDGIVLNNYFYSNEIINIEFKNYLRLTYKFPIFYTLKKYKLLDYKLKEIQN